MAFFKRKRWDTPNPGWLDRVSSYATRRKLVLVSEDATGNTYDVQRSEGEITEEGDAFNAENMNELEDRIEEVINDLNDAINGLSRLAVTGQWNDILGKPTIPQGTVTSVRVQATSPVVSSVNSTQSTSLNTTISLADGYGDTKNPYASKTKNMVLASSATANSVPSFRALVEADIPSLSAGKVTSGTFAAARIPTLGKITNAGDITTNVAIASGDRLVINDESSSQLNNSSITFGTSETTFLTNKGTWKTPSGTYTSLNCTKLWTNSNPSANFASQDISLSGLSSYKVIIIIVFNSAGSPSNTSLPWGYNVIPYRAGTVMINGISTIRYATLAADKITIGPDASHPERCVPYEIWGLK